MDYSSLQDPKGFRNALGLKVALNILSLIPLLEMGIIMEQEFKMPAQIGQHRGDEPHAIQPKSIRGLTKGN